MSVPPYNPGQPPWVPPTKKSNKGLIITLIVIFVVLPLLFFVGCTALVGGAVNEIDKEMKVTASAVANDPARITLDEFNKIDAGMTKKEVDDIVGSKGELSSSNDLVKTYSYEGNDTFAFALVSYVNGKVSNLSQSGLK